MQLTRTLSGLMCALFVAAGAPAQAPSETGRDARSTFPVTTHLVEVDVIVTDKEGRPVRGLTGADFQVFEDRKEQPIEFFSVESEEPQGPADDEPSTLTASTADFSNRIGSRLAGSVSVILIDRLNTNFGDQAQAKKRVVKFLGQIQREDRVALYLLDPDSVRVLHDFTSDTASLLRVLARHGGTASPELQASEPDAPPETGNAELDAFLRDSSEKTATAFMENRVKATGSALEAIAHHLGGVRGRKNLIWVSSGFPLVVDKVSRSDDLNRANRAMSDANIAIYPVDARGLMGAFSVGPATLSAVPQRSTGPVLRSTMTNLDTTMTNLESLQIMAEATGGQAFSDNNDIGRGIRRAIDDGRFFYTLGYSPAHGKWDGRFHPISVKVMRPGVDVRHRKGYLALAAPKPLDATRRWQALQEIARSRLQATGIGLRARAQWLDPKAGQLNLAIKSDPRSVTLEKTAQGWEGSVDLAIAQSLSDGSLMKSLDTTVELLLTGEQRERLIREGLVLNKKLVLHEAAEQLHVVVRDVRSGSLGSLAISADKLRAAAQR